MYLVIFQFLVSDLPKQAGHSMLVSPLLLDTWLGKSLLSILIIEPIAMPSKIFRTSVF